MSPPRVVLLAGAVAASLLACHGSPTAPIAVALQLDRSTYVARPVGGTGQYEVRLVVRYHNGTAATIYFARCRLDRATPVYAVPTADGVADSGYNPVWACTAAPAIEFQPGATRTDTLTLFGPTAYDGITHQPLGVLAGRFRLEYLTDRCPGCTEAGPRVASSPFQVLLQ